MQELKVGIIRATGLLAILSANTSLNASECFCLADADDNFRHSCEEQQQGNLTVVHCRATDDTPIKITDLHGWQKLLDGEGRCQPCQRSLGNGVGSIRGQDEADTSDKSTDD